LVGRPLELRDIESIDTDFAKAMTAVTSPAFADTSPELFTQLFPSTFQVQTALGETVDLIPGGAGIAVSEENRSRYVTLCKEFRLNEFLPALTQLRDGFWSIFPREAATLLHPFDLKELICGDDDCTVEELMKICTVHADPGNRAPMFWQVMRSFTPAERLDFITFASGKSGLPPTGNAEWHIDIVFSPSENRPPGTEQLAHAATCYLSITIPYYPTEQIMATKLRAAFKFSSLITDSGFDLQAMGQLL
jgi:hypothetical protein